MAVGATQILLKWSALSSQVSWLPLLLAPVLARGALLIPMNLFPAARKESLGAVSREGNWRIGFLIALPAVLIAPKLAIVAVVTAMLVAWFAARRLNGGISGDVYGAIVEITEVAVLIGAFV